MSPSTPPTIPFCHRCGKKRVLYPGSICKPCERIEKRLEEAKKKGGRR